MCSLYKYNKVYRLIWVSVIAVLTSCSSRPTDVSRRDMLPDIFPDYVGVTIPVGIAPLNFSMADDSFTTIDVEVRGKVKGSLHANGAFADFNIDEWHRLLDDNIGSQLVFTVCAEQNGAWVQYRDFTVNVSKFPLDEWGVTYRRIAPGYALYGHMGLYQRDLSTFDESALLENSQVPGQCLNCHTANRTQPDVYVFHVRGAHGATVIRNDKLETDRLEVLKARNDSLGGSMVYPYWHPGGRYCAFSTNRTSQMFHTGNNKRIEVYDSSSDVLVYDTYTHTILEDSLIMMSGWAENTPAFSPDGKWLYFTTAKQQDYPDGYDQEKYSLCRIDFDEKTGTIGSQVDTLINVRKTGKSVTWPRPSYDGRYVVYTQTDYGYFSVWHPEADLWLLDLQTGKNRPMTEVNSNRAESFHNWSVNSRWLLFTSRRADGLYTHLYFSSLDEMGRFTKPFLLPQRDPKRYYGRSMYSFNTPDFASGPLHTDAQRLGQLIEGEQRTATKVSIGR